MNRSRSLNTKGAKEREGRRVDLVVFASGVFLGGLCVKWIWITDLFYRNKEIMEKGDWLYPCNLRLNSGPGGSEAFGGRTLNAQGTESRRKEPEFEHEIREGTQRAEG